jgi:hypothetical protein
MLQWYSDTSPFSIPCLTCLTIIRLGKLWQAANTSLLQRSVIGTK